MGAFGFSLLRGGGAIFGLGGLVCTLTFLNSASTAGGGLFVDPRFFWRLEDRLLINISGAGGGRSGLGRRAGVADLAGFPEGGASR